MQLLLEHGATVDHITDDGITPLCAACQHGRVGVAKLLLEHGAMTERGTTTGTTPLCAASRSGHDSSVELVLKHERKFYASSDVAVVASLYKTFFDAVAPEQEALVFAKLGWAVQEAQALAEVLPSFPKLRSLDLSGNKLGPDGAKAIGAALRVSASLTSLE